MSGFFIHKKDKLYLKKFVYFCTFIYFCIVSGKSHLIPRASTPKSTLEVLLHIRSVFAMDLRGHGKSAHEPNYYLLKTHVEEIVLFIKKRLKESVILVGFSLGNDCFSVCCISSRTASEAYCFRVTINFNNFKSYSYGAKRVCR